MTPDVGAHPLTGVGELPNVTIAFPGEHWSNRRASGQVVPGAAVVPVNSGGKLYMRVAKAADTALVPQLAIALRTIDTPDQAGGSIYTQALGPNEISNLPIATHEYVHAYYSGAFHLTLVTPAQYAPGDLIGWDEDGVRPTGKSGTGAWAKNASADLDSIFEVLEWREFNASHEGILTVRSLRGQF